MQEIIPEGIYMKKILAVLLCAALFLVLTACDSVSVSTDVIKPTRDPSAHAVTATPAPVVTATPAPVGVNVPAGAVNVRTQSYQDTWWIDEIIFDYNGNTWYFRTAATPSVENISGIYADGMDKMPPMNAGAPCCFTNEWDQGVVIWYENGCSHSLSVLQNARAPELIGVFHALNGN